ncbi:MAG: ABC transporter permease [Oscillospiraceae bacterium]|nr:ABC transporter permease [Oscillospiraceae bacterium]
MKILGNVVRRNLKLFFKDKGMFFSALITPLILLVLYATFLAKLYRDSFANALPEGTVIAEKLLNGTVTSQLVSALLAVSCVTVSFCANLMMISDKANGISRDFLVSPVKRSTLAAGYYIASAASTLIVTFSALGACLAYLAFQGWYLSFTDVLLVAGDVFLLTLFGTALSSCVNFFLNTNGQASAVGTIISAGYGFICGAYMPIASFGEGLQRVLGFFPGTYGTCLLKKHMMQGVFAEMEAVGFPAEVVKGIRDSIDVNLYFYGKEVSASVMFAVLAGSVLFFTGLFVLFHILRKNARRT